MQYVKVWDKMRRSLKLPQEMQLYSLRDTGINNMLKAGIDPLTVMQAADHHDLSMTTRYANHADPNLIRTLTELAPKF
jgi:integrase